MAPADYIFIKPVIDTEKLTGAVASYFKPTVFDRIDFIENMLKNQL